jgi:2-phospho-L-lactate guanylyltransferase (CobY/MobA/RfbA family)
MTFAETIAKEIIHNMSKQERERFVSLMLDEFFQTMTIDERKEILIKFVPDIVGRALEGMSLRDRTIVVEAALHVISHPEHQGKEKGSGIG